MGVDYLCYGCINVEVKEEARNMIKDVVNQTSFSVNINGDIVHDGGSDGAGGLYQDFKDLMEMLYEEIDEAYDLIMFGKIIIDFTDYYEASNIMVMAVDYDGKVTVFPDNT